MRFAPGVGQLLHYQRGWLRGDLMAGVTVAAYLVPQVMAYAELAGLPAVTGLWAVIGAMTVYALIGSSPQLSVGPESTTALMTAVYSQHYFGDDSLLPTALAAQRDCALTLVCSPDGIPWEAAGLLRDGETARQAVHRRLLDLLEQEGLSYRLLGGNLQNRVASARALITPLGPSSWIAP